jgi:hypothetical protein
VSSLKYRSSPLLIFEVTLSIILINGASCVILPVSDHKVPAVVDIRDKLDFSLVPGVLFVIEIDIEDIELSTGTMIP